MVQFLLIIEVVFTNIASAACSYFFGSFISTTTSISISSNKRGVTPKSVESGFKMLEWAKESIERSLISESGSLSELQFILLQFISEREESKLGDSMNTPNFDLR